MSKRTAHLSQLMMDRLKGAVTATSLVITVLEVRRGKVWLEVSTADEFGPLTVLGQEWIDEKAKLSLNGFSEVFKFTVV